MLGTVILGTHWLSKGTAAQICKLGPRGGVLCPGVSWLGGTADWMVICLSSQLLTQLQAPAFHRDAPRLNEASSVLPSVASSHNAVGWVPIGSWRGPILGRGATLTVSAQESLVD